MIKPFCIRYFYDNLPKKGQPKKNQSNWLFSTGNFYLEGDLCFKVIAVLLNFDHIGLYSYADIYIFFFSPGLTKHGILSAFRPAYITL